jgi:uncharacterized protein YjdB
MNQGLVDWKAANGYGPRGFVLPTGETQLSITVSPTSKSLLVGDYADFTAAVDPPGTYTIQWFDASDPASPKATGTTFRFTAVVAGNFAYYAKVAGTAVQSGNISITVTKPVECTVDSL